MAKNDVDQRYSRLSERYLLDICKRFHIGDHLNPTLPQAGQTIKKPPAEMVGVYVYFFSDANLRLPLSKFFVDILSTYKVTISQLSPNAVSKIVSFEILCNALKITPTPGLFRCFQQLETNGDWFTFSTRRGSENIFTNFKDSIKNWKTKFFFVKKSIASIPMEWEWRKGSGTDSKPESGVYNVHDKDTLSKYTIPIQKLSNEILLMAGIGCDGVEKNTLCQEDGQGADLLELLGVQIKSKPAFAIQNIKKRRKPASSRNKDVKGVNNPDVVLETPHTLSHILFSKKGLDSLSGENEFLSHLRKPEPTLLSTSASGGSTADFQGTSFSILTTHNETYEEERTSELKRKDVEVRCEKAQPECIEVANFVAKECEDVDVNPPTSEVIPIIHVAGPSSESFSSFRPSMSMDDLSRLGDFLDAEQLCDSHLSESLVAKFRSIMELDIECDRLRESNKTLKEKADCSRAQLNEASDHHHKLLDQNINLREELVKLQTDLLFAHNVRYSCNKKVGDIDALDSEIIELKEKALEDKAKEVNLLSQIKAINTEKEDVIAKHKVRLKILDDMIFHEHLKCDEKIGSLGGQITACYSARKASEEKRLALVKDCSWLIRYGFQIFVKRLFNSHEFASSIAPVVDAALRLGYKQGCMTMVGQCAHLNLSIELPRYDALPHDIENAYGRFCEQEWEYLKALALRHDQPLEDLKSFFPKKAP